ncbi:MAG: BTAD domain-containing putative transcriptional regulator [Alphaproteobacteria bacterium]|nr:BTAD domain-containing putative transcriptional regulator [Alphaproteobacteria bacterium]
MTGAGGPPLPTRKAEALLAYLAVSAGRAHRREKLATLLWRDRGDVQARHSLAQTLYLIRRTFGEEADGILIAKDRAVSLDPLAIEIDVGGFETLAAEPKPDRLLQATALYRGEMLEGFHVPEENFEEWLLVEQRRLRNLAVAALERLLRHQVECGDDTAAIETARRLLALDPLQEPVHRTLMRLHTRAGRDEAAIRQYLDCAGILRRELDVEPDAATAALYRDIRAGRASAKSRPGTAGPLEADLPRPHAEVLSIEVQPSRILRADARDPHAHDYVSRGIAYHRRLTKHDNATAKEMFLRAIELDPDYAPAYACLGWVLVHDVDRGWSSDLGMSLNAQRTAGAGFYLAKAFGAVGAMYLWIGRCRQAATERRRRYYARTLVAPPSTTHGLEWAPSRQIYPVSGFLEY